MAISALSPCSPCPLIGVRGWLAIALLLLPSGAAVLAEDDAPADDRLRVVYHINADDPDLHLNALRNLQNHLSGAGGDTDSLEIKVVLHGGGVRLLEYAVDDPDLRTTVDTLRLQDVRFLVGGNTLDSRGLSLDDLYDVEPADRVDSGITELMRLQQAGYTYIKP